MLAAWMTLALGQDAADRHKIDLSVRAKYIGPDYFVHRMVLRFAGNKLEYAVKSRQSVVQINEDGDFTTEFEVIQSKLWTNGKPSTTSFRRFRSVTSRAEWFSCPTFIVGEAGSGSLANLISYRAPGDKVAMGNSWSAGAPGEPGWTATYTFAGRETVAEQEAAVIEFTSKTSGSAKPATCTGKFWVAIDRGTVIEMFARASNVDMAGKKAEVTVKLEASGPDVPIMQVGG
jgi:hypothetical protein